MHFSTSHLITGIALLAPAAQAWRWTWNDAKNSSHVEIGTKPRPCSPMDMTKDMQYHWQPQEDAVCIELFSDDSCDDRNGNSCAEWGPRALGQAHVRSWLVRSSDNDGDDKKSSTTGSASPTGSMTGSTMSGRTMTGTSMTGTETTMTSSAPESTTSPEESSPTEEATPTESETGDDSESTESPAPSETGAASTLSGGSTGLVFGAVLAAFFGL